MPVMNGEGSKRLMPFNDLFIAMPATSPSSKSPITVWPIGVGSNFQKFQVLSAGDEVLQSFFGFGIQLPGAIMDVLALPVGVNSGIEMKNHPMLVPLALPLDVTLWKIVHLQSVGAAQALQVVAVAAIVLPHQVGRVDQICLVVNFAIVGIEPHQGQEVLAWGKHVASSAALLNRRAW